MSIPDTSWSAIVLAGQRPSGDPMADRFGVRFKAHIPVDGVPMLARVVEAARAVPAIGRVIVIAQDERVMDVLAPGEATFSQGGAGISASVEAVAGSDAAPWPVLITTADHPLLTPAMLRHMLDFSAQGDLAVGMVERDTVLRAYPENRRTWLRMRDGHWTGANLFALRTERVRSALALWAQVEQDRKKAWKLFARFGPALFLRALTRTVGMRSGLALAGRRLGLDARLVDLPFAEAAIDVDKPSDHALAEAILSRR